MKQPDQMETAAMSTNVQQSPGTITGCVEFAGLFQDPLLEEPPTASAPREARRRYFELAQTAENLCMACPLITECLYRAVVEHDVAGFAAGTTQKQRLEIRRRLGVSVAPEDFDTLAGLTRRHRQIDHDEVVRLRHANPQESLEALARRLGCSLSTVKRHLRHERQAPTVRDIRDQPRPSRDQVLAVYAQVSTARQQRDAAA
jgi:hypothetical protein